MQEISYQLGSALEKMPTKNWGHSPRTPAYPAFPSPWINAADSVHGNRFFRELREIVKE